MWKPSHWRPCCAGRVYFTLDNIKHRDFYMLQLKISHVKIPILCILYIIKSCISAADKYPNCSCHFKVSCQWNIQWMHVADLSQYKRLKISEEDNVRRFISYCAADFCTNTLLDVPFKYRCSSQSSWMCLVHVKQFVHLVYLNDSFTKHCQRHNGPRVLSSKPE